MDACASWQLPQPFATGACGNFAAAAPSTTRLWQLAQSCALACVKSDGFAEACGSWQPTHAPSRTGWWTLFACAGTAAAWHVRQTAFGSLASSFPCREACG